MITTKATICYSVNIADGWVWCALLRAIICYLAPLAMCGLIATEWLYTAPEIKLIGISIYSG